MNEKSIAPASRARLGPAGQAVYAAAVLAVMAGLLVASRPASDWRPAILTRDVFAPGAGRVQALPPDALDAIALIHDHGLTGYRLGADLRSRPLVSQRVIEGAYPIRQARLSANVIDYRPAIDGEACRIVATRGRMAYATCDAK